MSFSQQILAASSVSTKIACDLVTVGGVGFNELNTSVLALLFPGVWPVFKLYSVTARSSISHKFHFHKFHFPTLESRPHFRVCRTNQS